MLKQTYVCDLCKKDFWPKSCDFNIKWHDTFVDYNLDKVFIRFKKFILMKWVKADYYTNEFDDLKKIEHMCGECSEDIENYILSKVKGVDNEI